MINIEREYKPLSIKRNSDRFEEEYNESVECLSIKRDNLIYLFEDAIKISQWWSFDLTNENKQKSIKALKLAAKAGEAIFRLGREPEKEQRVVIDDILDATYNGKGLLWEGGFLSAILWQEVFFCAAIVRDKAVMDSLVQFPVSLMRQCSTKSLEAEYLLVELIQCIHRREPFETFMMHLTNVGKEITSDEKKHPWVEYGSGAKFDFIMAFMLKDKEAPKDPSEALASALTEYWNYHERHCDKGYQQPRFYMPIPLLGLACMAKDYGNELNVRSDFIPQFYIDGDYL